MRTAIRNVLLLLIVLCAPFTYAQTSIGSFDGGDVGDGLDLDGNFVYAVNVRGPAAGTIRDAVFTDDSAPGVIVSATDEILNWSSPNYGGTANDNNLELVMQSIRFSVNPAQMTVALANLVPGRTYQLQLLFTEACCDRGFDVFAEGNLIADEFSPQDYSGINSTPTEGGVITHTFVAQDTTLNITLDGSTAAFQDPNPTLNGLTLEDLGFATLPAEVPALDAKALVLLAAALAVIAAMVLRA